MCTAHRISCADGGHAQAQCPVKVSGQQGLWFQIELPAGKPGYVRVNDVRMAYAGKENATANLNALFTGKAGKGRVTETAGVRGLDESDLKSAGFDAAQFAKLEGYRLTADAAAAQARATAGPIRSVAYAAEAKPASGAKGGATPGAEARRPVARARPAVAIGASVGSVGDSALDVADAAAGKSEEEQTAEELALGPEIAGRILGAAKLVPDDAAQRRVNRIGRWMASHSSRPELPWTFGIIDTPEVNAFAAPGGYVLVTRGMYELLADDGEVAGVLGHEISHVVQRDHYNVIRKQEVASASEEAVAGQVNVGGGLAGQMAKDYVRSHGATVMLTSLDRGARIPLRRSVGDLSRPFRLQSAGAVCGAAEDDRARHRFARAWRSCTRPIRRWMTGSTASTAAVSPAWKQYTQRK